jgi:hypothetical protein
MVTAAQQLEAESGVYQLVSSWYVHRFKYGAHRKMEEAESSKAKVAGHPVFSSWHVYRVKSDTLWIIA